MWLSPPKQFSQRTMIDKLFHYQAEVIKVIDGDTIDVRVDLGFSVFKEVRLRLARINAPELKGAEKQAGLASRRVLSDMLLTDNAQARVYIKTEQETDKYGRYIADVYLKDGLCVNERLVELGYAVYATYNQIQADR